MLTEKLLKYIEAQTTLAASVMDGSATDEQRAELRRVNAIVAAANGQYAPQCETELASLNEEEFRKYVEGELEAMDSAPDVDRIALLHENVTDVRRQAKNGAEMFAVRMPVAKSDADEMTALKARIAALEAKVSEKAEGDEPEGGDIEVSGEEEAESKQESASAMLGVEALDAMILAMGALLEKIQSGTATEEDLQRAFGNTWAIEQAVDLAIALMGKSADLCKMLEEALPGLREMAEKNDGGEDGDEAEEKAEEDNAEEDAGEEDAGEEEEGGEETEKGDRAWAGDLASEVTGERSSSERYRALKRSRK